MVVCICLSDVHIVGLDVDWQQCLCIEINDLEARLIEVMGCDRGCNIVEHDGFAWVGHTLRDFVVLDVSMAAHHVANDVLVPLHQGSVASSELVLEAARRIVSDNEGDAVVSFNVGKLLLQPSEHATWVFSLAVEVEVEAVACLRVESDQS